MEKQKKVFCINMYDTNCVSTEVHSFVFNPGFYYSVESEETGFKNAGESQKAFSQDAKTEGYFYEITLNKNREITSIYRIAKN